MATEKAKADSGPRTLVKRVLSFSSLKSNKEEPGAGRVNEGRKTITTPQERLFKARKTERKIRGRSSGRDG
jgi:hypothetical protein